MCGRGSFRLPQASPTEAGGAGPLRRAVPVASALPPWRQRRTPWVWDVTCRRRDATTWSPRTRLVNAARVRAGRGFRHCATVRSHGAVRAPFRWPFTRTRIFGLLLRIRTRLLRRLPDVLAARPVHARPVQPLTPGGDEGGGVAARPAGPAAADNVARHPRQIVPAPGSPRRGMPWLPRERWVPLGAAATGPHRKLGHQPRRALPVWCLSRER
jgi:hypothetical protein